MRTPLREIRANMRGVVLTSTLLVVVTAAAVAVAAHVLLDGRDGVCAGSPAQRRLVLAGELAQRRERYSSVVLTAVV
jgi:monovalent cation/hydrogen antiporter